MGLETGFKLALKLLKNNLNKNLLGLFKIFVNYPFILKFSLMILKKNHEINYSRYGGRLFMAFVGGITGGAVAAAIAASKKRVPCYICGKEIQVLESGEDENTCVSCGHDFCNNHGISYIYVRCFNRTPNRFQTRMLEDRERLYEKNKDDWVFIVVVIIEI
jgi:hypothetical protein